MNTQGRADAWSRELAAGDYRFTMLAYIALFFGAFIAAAISGAAGFGGALLLLPLLNHVVGTSAAVPLLTLAQAVGNAARVGWGWRQIRWRPVGWFLAAAIPCAVLGALSFVALPKPLVVRCIGGAILGFVVLTFFKLLRLRPGRGLLLAGGGVVGFLSGLVGSAGPLGAAVFLSLELPPVAYIASEAVTALAMHGVKTAVYQRSLTLGRETWLLALLLGVAMIAGTWASKRVIERMKPEKFRAFVAILLVILALQMLLCG